MGFFSKSEFLHGLRVLGAIKSIPQLKKSLSSQCKTTMANPNEFHSFYTFAFRFCLTEHGQKIIDVPTCIALLQTIYPEGRFTTALCEYLEHHQQDYKTINLDQWDNILRFSREVKEDMSNADENPAWPVLLDNFVEFVLKKAHKQKNTHKHNGRTTLH